MDIYNEIKAKMIDMDEKRVLELIKRALDEGLSAEEILNQALIPAMDIVGEKYEQGDWFIPEMLFVANIMKAGMAVLRPLLVGSGAKMQAKVAMGTVKGDMHDIGANLVSIMLEGGGFEVENLGADVPNEKFVKVVKENGVTLIGMSALLTTTMVTMKEVIKALSENGVRNTVKVMIGGAGVTQDYADEIGADGFAADGMAAVRLARRLTAGK